MGNQTRRWYRFKKAESSAEFAAEDVQRAKAGVKEARRRTWLMSETKYEQDVNRAKVRLADAQEKLAHKQAALQQAEDALYPRKIFRFRDLFGD